MVEIEGGGYEGVTTTFSMGHWFDGYYNFLLFFLLIESRMINRGLNLFTHVVSP